MPWSSQGHSLTTPGPRGWCHSKPQTGVSFKCRRLLVHLRGRGCPVSAGPPRHLPHSPLPLHPPTSSTSMGSQLQHPPHSTTIIPLPPHHPPTHHQPPARTRCRCTLWDMLSLPGDLSISCSHQKPGGPIEYLGVAGRSEDKEPPTGCVQVSDA